MKVPENQQYMREDAVKVHHMTVFDRFLPLDRVEE